MTNAPQPLRLGMFVMPIHDPAKPLGQCLDEDLELAMVCEELGFQDFWVGEHHSSSYENIVMPEIFLAKVLGMTKSIRVGPAPVCLQYHHPVHVAGRLAMLDHLSHGRLNVCFGPGAIPTDMEIYGVDPKDIGARVAESIDMILKLWASDGSVEIEGRFWNIRMREHIAPEYGLGALPKPLQRPHPPIHVPCISRASAGLKAAAARGFRPISHHMIHAEVLADQWKTYAQGAAEGGRTADPASWCVARNVFVADSDGDARACARDNSLGACIRYILDLTGATAPTGIEMWKRNKDQATADVNLDYFLDDVILAGGPETVTDRLLRLREEVGPFGTLVLVAHDWDDRSRWLRSLELFAREVVPRFNKAIGAESEKEKEKEKEREKQSSTLAHCTLAVRDVERASAFFERTLGWRPIRRPGNINRSAAWLQIAPGQELHLLEVRDYQPSPFEREFGRHIAIEYPRAGFETLKARLVAAGAELIAPERETPFERFFFRSPDGYIFEVIQADHVSESADVESMAP